MNINNKNIKHIILAAECVALLAMAVLVVLSVRKADNLTSEMNALESEVSGLKSDLEQVEKEKNEKAAAEAEAAEKAAAEKAAAEKAAAEAALTETPAPTRAPSPTPTPTPTPTPAFLTDLSGYNPGDILEETVIDWGNLGNFFTSSVIVEGDAIFERIIGKSFQYNDNIGLSDLRYIKLIHRNFNAQTQVGELIVNAAIEADILDIFLELYRNGYQINSMYLIDNFWTGEGESSDFASIEMDNTSAFCYRTVTGSSGNLSNHAYGLAIDLNPLENPYVRLDGNGYGSSEHEGSQAYIYDRDSAVMAHVIDYNDLAYQLFTAHGFTWGGDWSNPKDYQHFQKEFG